MGLITDFLIDKAKDAAISKAKDITVDKVKDAAIDKAKDMAIDKAKDMAIDKAEELYMGKEEQHSGCASNILRFFISLIWLVVILAVDIMSFIVFNPMIGAGMEFCIFLITICVPYLRKKGTLTRWWGWLALLSAISLVGLAFGH